MRRLIRRFLDEVIDLVRPFARRLGRLRGAMGRLRRTRAHHRRMADAAEERAAALRRRLAELGEDADPDELDRLRRQLDEADADALHHRVREAEADQDLGRMETDVRRMENGQEPINEGEYGDLLD